MWKNFHEKSLIQFFMIPQEEVNEAKKKSLIEAFT